jgi:hydrogenase maturation protease
MRPRILACGTLDGGDDAAGLLAARALPAGLRVEVSAVGQLSAEHFTDDPPGRVRIVVDAVHGLPPGELLELPLAQLPALAPRLRPASSHAIGPAGAVALAAALGQIHAGDRFVGIGGECYGLGTDPSARVRAALPALTDRLAQLVEAGDRGSAGSR